MTIIEALKREDKNVRLSYGDRWLIWDETIDNWVVYERKYAAKSTKIFYSGDNEGDAVLGLLSDFDEN